MTADGPADALAAAAIPRERRSRTRPSALTGRERRLYGWILTSFRAGHPPNGDELAPTGGVLTEG